MMDVCYQDDRKLKEPQRKQLGMHGEHDVRVLWKDAT